MDVGATVVGGPIEYDKSDPPMVFSGTPEHVTYEWFEAWSRHDWKTMQTYSQKYWVARAGKKALGALQGSFGSWRPVRVYGHAKDITPPNFSRSLVRDFLVDVLLMPEQGFEGLRVEITLRLLKEDSYDKRPWWKRPFVKLLKRLLREPYVPIPSPSPEGTWGVNPISATRRGRKK